MQDWHHQQDGTGKRANANGAPIGRYPDTMTTAARKLIAVGEIHTTAAGRYVLSSQLTADGGVTITLWDGIDATTARRFPYWNRDLARSRYTEIRALARNGHTAEQIQQRINFLDSAAYLAAGSSIADTAALVAAEAQAERYETKAERAERAAITARLNADLDNRAAKAEPVTDPAVDYLNQLTSQRHTAINAAVAAADRIAGNLADRYQVKPGRANRVKYPSLNRRPLTPAMKDLLNNLKQAGRIDLSTATPAERRTAWGLINRGMADPVKRTNARRGQPTLTAITLPEPVEAVA